MAIFHGYYVKLPEGIPYMEHLGLGWISTALQILTWLFLSLEIPSRRGGWAYPFEKYESVGFRVFPTEWKNKT